jgi:hypothetical protein
MGRSLIPATSRSRADADGCERSHVWSSRHLWEES